MENHLKEFLLQANSKALATYGSQGLNLISVSTIYIEDHSIILVDYFMEKTIKNIQENKEVSFAAWSKLYGYQLRCICDYILEGELFEKIKERVYPIHPERVVRGILVLKVNEIFDIAPTKDTKDFFIKNNI